MGHVHQLKEPKNKQPADEDQAPKPDKEPLDTLAELVRHAQEKEGYIEPQEVLKLAAAAEEAIESLLSDMERATREALQEAVFETFLVKGNA